jgi:hypothetical protein
MKTITNYSKWAKNRKLHTKYNREGFELNFLLRLCDYFSYSMILEPKWSIDWLNNNITHNHLLRVLSIENNECIEDDVNMTLNRSAILSASEPILFPRMVKTWPIISWTLKDWCQKIGDTRKLPFRVGVNDYTVVCFFLQKVICVRQLQNSIFLSADTTVGVYVQLKRTITEGISCIKLR